MDGPVYICLPGFFLSSITMQVWHTLMHWNSMSVLVRPTTSGVRVLHSSVTPLLVQTVLLLPWVEPTDMAWNFNSFLVRVPVLSLKIYSINPSSSCKF